MRSQRYRVRAFSYRSASRRLFHVKQFGEMCSRENRGGVCGRGQSCPRLRLGASRGTCVLLVQRLRPLRYNTAHGKRTEHPTGGRARRNAHARPRHRAGQCVAASQAAARRRRRALRRARVRGGRDLGARPPGRSARGVQEAGRAQSRRRGAGGAGRRLHRHGRRHRRRHHGGVRRGDIRQARQPVRREAYAALPVGSHA